MNPAITTLLHAGILAPSGDNTQPWRFVLDENESSFAIEVDATRDPSPMNAGQRMARMACGAALENIVRTARYNDWPLDVEPSSGTALATVKLPEPPCSAGLIDTLITARVTNRRFYDGAALNSRIAKLNTMRSAHSDVQFHWIVDRPAIGRMARLIGEADAMLFGIEPMRSAFLDNIRFDVPANAAAEDRLPIGTLELARGERLGLRCLRYLPDSLIQFGGILRSFRRRAAALVESASGLCVISARGEPAPIDLAVGQAFQQAWLALTADGLAAQPMMSLPVLENWRMNWPAERHHGRAARQVADLENRFRSELQLSDDQRVAAVLRFGGAKPPATRTARRKLDACLVERGSYQQHEKLVTA